MPPRTRSSIGLLDTLIILLLACTLALFILWLGGEVRGRPLLENVPDFVVKAYSSIWSYLTGAAGSAVLALLRSKSGQGPNYLLYTSGATLVLLLLVFGVAYGGPGQQRDRRALLKFSLESEKKDHPNLSFFQREPLFREAHTIAPENDGHYQEYVDLPETRSRFYGLAVRSVTISESTNSPVSRTVLCFERNPTRPANNPPLESHLVCAEGKRCSIGADDPGWISACQDDNSKPGQTSSLIPLLHAEGVTAQVAAQPGWKVPSLETLRTMGDRERVGYTEFTVKGNDLTGMAEADSFRYLIRVNGSPLYVDGWPPEDMLKPFKASEGLTFAFGLENLSFSGADDGCEKIELSLEFHQKDRTLKQVAISRRYSALRDAAQEQVKSLDGTPFTWVGKYIKPKNEDRFELFVTSTNDLKRARDAKVRLDNSKLTFNSMDVVGVLRSPLNNPNYGIVIGLRQPTGQIRFTFDQPSAQDLRKWIFGVRGHNAELRTVLRQDAFLYQMKPGDSGLGQLRSCSGAAK